MKGLGVGVLRNQYLKNHIKMACQFQNVFNQCNFVSLGVQESMNTSISDLSQERLMMCTVLFLSWFGNLLCWNIVWFYMVNYDLNIGRLRQVALSILTEVSPMHKILKPGKLNGASLERKRAEQILMKSTNGLSFW